MAVIRYHLVKVSTVGQPGSQKAVIELDDANRLIVTRLDPATGAKQDIVMDAALADLHVKRSQNTLAFTTPTATHKLDFAPGSTTALLAGGAVGMLVHSAVTGPNDLPAWIKELESRGVKIGKWGPVRIASLVFLVIVAVLIVAAVATGWGTR